MLMPKNVTDKGFELRSFDMTTTKILFKIHVYENDNKKNPSASKDKLV